MSMRLAKSLSGAARLRPTTALLHQHFLPALTTARFQSTSTSTPTTTPDPKSRAQSILDSLPGSSLVSKTAILSSAAGVSIWAISNELYIVNEESIVALSLLSVFAAIGKFGGPLYKEWADTQVNKIRDILNSARADHTQAVKDRIENVSQMATVVEVTRDLFAVSKETAQLEAQAFQLEQQTTFAAEAKSVLDSWVRYEAQVKQRQQKELADTLIAKVKKELENPKTLQSILQQSVQDVERIIAKA
ncbi:atp4 subunit B of the stator stalk of mitochondrial F1F0 ATP synthase [Maublancomyces gigas]|uniref:ATP synthase subunit 4 n=1 Tax=Discina gigas TaxID=1032678 RepID=A0ABR3G9Q1_9PEZI